MSSVKCGESQRASTATLGFARKCWNVLRPSFRSLAFLPLVAPLVVAFALPARADTDGSENPNHLNTGIHRTYSNGGDALFAFRAAYRVEKAAAVPAASGRRGKKKPTRLAKLVPALTVLDAEARKTLEEWRKTNDPQKHFEAFASLLDQLFAKTRAGETLASEDLARLSEASAHLYLLNFLNENSMLNPVQSQQLADLKKVFDEVRASAGLYSGEAFFKVVSSLLDSALSSGTPLMERVHSFFVARTILSTFDEDAVAKLTSENQAKLKALSTQLVNTSTVLKQDLNSSLAVLEQQIHGFDRHLSEIGAVQEFGSLCLRLMDFMQWYVPIVFPAESSRALSVYSAWLVNLEAWNDELQADYDRVRATDSGRGALGSFDERQVARVARDRGLFDELYSIVVQKPFVPELLERMREMFDARSELTVERLPVLPTPAASMPPLVFDVPPVVTTQVITGGGLNESILNSLGFDEARGRAFNRLYQSGTVQGAANALAMIPSSYLLSSQVGFTQPELGDFKRYVARLQVSPNDIEAQRGLIGILRSHKGTAFVDAAGVSFHSSKKELQMRVFLPTYAEAGATWLDGGVTAVVRLKEARLRGSGTTTDYNFDLFGRDSETSRPTLERDETLGAEGEVTLLLDKMTGERQAPQISLRFGKAGETWTFGARVVRADRTSWNRAIEDLVKGHDAYLTDFFVDLLRTVSSVSYSGQVDGISAHQIGVSSSLLHFTVGPVSIEVTGEGGATIVPRTASIPGSVDPYGAVSVCAAVGTDVLVFQTPHLCATVSVTGNGTQSYNLISETGIKGLEGLRVKAGVEGTDNDAAAFMLGVRYEF
ncbi:hypothetical protein HY992_06325 [Candidatus Micrarchaeota archaeon]|nr:hypothetical protein [Candidatus Micrarchaeota archaeon]